MNKESVGKLFKGSFGIYKCVAYSDKPSVVMKNTITNESICVSIDSNYAKTFELIEEDKKIRKICTFPGLDDDDYAYEDGNRPNNVKINNKMEELLINKINEIIEVLNEQK